MVTLTEITAIVGAVLGSVSLGIVLYKTIKDRPHLVFEIGKAYFMQPHDNDNFTSFNVPVRVDNKGERSTTIHSANLILQYEGKIYELKTNNDNVFSVTPDSSINQYFMFGLSKKETRVKDRVTNCKVIIKHTHGTETIQMSDILESV